MRPSREREKLRSKLIQSDLIRHSARYLFDERKREYIRRYEEQNNKAPSKDELIAFYEIAKGDLRKEIDEILVSFLDLCIQGSDSFYFIKNIALFSAVAYSFGMSLFIASLACFKSLFPSVEVNYSIGLQEYVSVGVAVSLWGIIAIQKATNFVKSNM